MINLEQDHRWIIAIYKENTLQEAKERLQAILGLCEDDMDIRLLVQETIQRLSKITEEEYQAVREMLQLRTDISETFKKKGYDFIYS